MPFDIGGFVYDTTFIQDYGKLGVVTDNLVLYLDAGFAESYPKGGSSWVSIEPTINLYAESANASGNTSIYQIPQSGTAVYSYQIDSSVGTWNSNTIFRLTGTAGTFASYTSLRRCLPASYTSTYGSTRRISAKIKMIKGDISSITIHTGGGNAAHNSSLFTQIPTSNVPLDVSNNSNWYQLDASVDWGSTTIGHCVGIGILSDDIEFLVTEFMVYPSDIIKKFVPFNYKGVLTNGPTFNSGNGGSIVFDGTNDYVDLNYNFGIFSSYTFSFWARQDVANRFLVSDKSSTFSQYWYGDNSWKYIHGGVSGEYYYPKNLNIPLGSWGNFVVTYDGSNVSIYRQGVFQGQQSTTGTSDWTSGIMLGNAVTINNYAYGGRISNFGLYNRALSSTEIIQNYNALKGRYGL